MRFKLTLLAEKNAFGSRIPFNYAYESSALIYKILSKSDAAFSAWLHDNGFVVDKKRFKLFTFSRLQIPNFQVDGSHINIVSDIVEWYISFLPERSTQEFVQGLFQEQVFELGNRRANVRFRVQSIEMVPSPEFTDRMTFETLSPICIVQKRDDGKQDYIAPDHPRAGELVRLNLLDKYEALHGVQLPQQDFPFELTILSPPKSSLITIKADTPQESKLRGFSCRLELHAPPELMRIAYEAGIGGKNSLGFGMVKC